jgi:hypothetical protein
MHVEDEYLSTTSDDDLIGVRFDQRIGRGLFVNAFVNIIEFDTARNIGTHASWSDPEQDLNLTLRYTALASDENRRSIDLDYYTEILATYFAYDQYDASIHKGLGDTLYLEGGAQWRELRSDGNEGLLNHEFRRYHATVGLDAWPFAGSDASATFELWDSGEDRFTTIGGDFSHEFDEDWSASVGTLFELFRYDPIRGSESEDVQVSYLKTTYHLANNQRLRARLEIEDGDVDDFVTFDLSMLIDF